MRTTLSPHQLLSHCQAVEAAHGRTRPAVNAPRTLDIDLLLYGMTVLDEPELQLPHPRLHLRDFVLAPLAEIATADDRHPLLGATLGDLAAALPAAGALTPCCHDW